MKILLTGGSGFIGSHFRKKLHDVELVNLDIKAPQTNDNPKHQYIQGDIRNVEDVRNAMKGCDIIVHLAAIWDDFSVDDSFYFDTNVNGSRVLIEVSKELGIKKFINYSSASVYGEYDFACVENKTPYVPVNAYGKSKLEAEGLFEEWAKRDSNVSIVHLRPSVVFGENNYGNIYRLINQISSGFYFNIKKGDALKSISYVENLVEATIFLMKSMKNGIEAYNYADEPHMNAIEISNVIAKALGKSNPITIPYGLAYTLAMPFDLLIAITKKNLPVSTMRVKKYCTQTLNSSEKLKTTGFKPTVDSKEGLKRMVEWYKQIKLKS
jgi:GlcNAc-P-P-Und epimerase